MKAPNLAMLGHVLSLGAVLLLTACGGPKVVHIAVPFDAAKARAMLQPGANEVVGSAYLKLSTGAIISCAGADRILQVM